MAPGMSRAATILALLSTVALAGGGPARATRLSIGGPPTAAGVISTVAGGVGGPARATKVSFQPWGVALGAGRLYIASVSSVRAVDPKTDHLTTLAGTGASGPLGDGGPATSASLDFATGVAVDGAGNVAVADFYGERVRVVAASTGTFFGQAMTAGDIYTVAGDGRAGFSGDGVPATTSSLSLPASVAVDGAGNLLIADSDNQRIRVVAASTGTFYGQSMTAGDIYTIAGDGHYGFSGDCGPATAAQLDFPEGVAVDAAGNVVIADTQDNRIRVVAASTGTFYGQAMTAGDIYTVAGDGTIGFAGDGGPATSAELNWPWGATVDGAGNLVIADTFNNRVRVVASSTGTFYGQAMTAGDIYTVAGGGTKSLGNGSLATSNALPYPQSVAVDGAGNLLIAGRGGRRVLVVAVTKGRFYRQRMIPGHLYSVAGQSNGNYSGDGGPATAAELWAPFSMAVDHADNMVITDGFNNRVRMVAASTGTFYGQAMTAGDIYTVAGDGKAGFSGDGGPATSAELQNPFGVAVDISGNLVIADMKNCRVRVVAASTGTFYGQAMTAGDIYTVAGNGKHGFTGDGGPATRARLKAPEGVAVDAAGNLVITDSGNNRLRVVAASTGTFYGQAMTAGDIYTIAGDGTAGFAGDSGPAISAELANPAAVAVNSAGDLLIVDDGNNRIREVTG
jgi:NHL repeat-containing protein